MPGNLFSYMRWSLLCWLLMEYVYKIYRHTYMRVAKYYTYGMSSYFPDSVYIVIGNNSEDGSAHSAKL